MSLRRMTVAAALVSALAAVAGPAHAGDRTVALAPLATLGSEARSRDTAAVEAAVAVGLASLPGAEVIHGDTLSRAIEKARKPALRSCDGNPRCLAALGALVGARYVVYGELGGLGDVQLVYLKAVDVRTARELRSTTLELGTGAGERAASAAAFRLLAPGRYRGRLHVEVDVADATIYVDGNKMAKSPAGPIELPVGSHALRVTHPEFRDFVRFVEIEFDSDERLGAELQKYPTIASSIGRDGKAVPAEIVEVRDDGVVVVRAPTPWYRRWYAVAGVSAAVLVTSAVVVGILADGTDSDRERTVDPPMAAPLLRF